MWFHYDVYVYEDVCKQELKSELMVQQRVSGSISVLLQMSLIKSSAYRKLIKFVIVKIIFICSVVVSIQRWLYGSRSFFFFALTLCILGIVHAFVTRSNILIRV